METTLDNALSFQTSGLKLRNRCSPGHSHTELVSDRPTTLAWALAPSPSTVNLSFDAFASETESLNLGYSK